MFVVEGQNITVSGWIFNGISGGESGVILWAIGTPDPSSNYKINSYYIPQEQGWTWFSFTGVVPSGYDSILIQLNATADASGSNIAFTRLKVESSTYPTPYSMEGDLSTFAYGSQIINAFAAQDWTSNGQATFPNGLTVGSTSTQITAEGQIGQVHGATTAGNFGVSTVLANQIGLSFGPDASNAQVFSTAAPFTSLYEIKTSVVVTDTLTNSSFSLDLSWEDELGTAHTYTILFGSTGFLQTSYIITATGGSNITLTITTSALDASVSAVLVGY